LDARLRDANLDELLAAMVDDFGVRGFDLRACIPRAAIVAVEASAAGARMAERCHDDARHRTAGDPLLARDLVQNAELGGHAIVGPAFELEDVGQIVGARDAIENPDRGKAAGYETAGVFRTKLQFQPPRRPSSKRRTW